MIAASKPVQRRDETAAPCAPAAGPAGRPRFTVDGDGALESQLEQTCARVRSGVRGLIPPRQLEAVWLGGGYGRGEGGVLRGPGGDRPYNDLEFYVAIKGNRHFNELVYRQRLEVLGEILTHLADAEIEFKITSRAETAGAPTTMFSYDLLAGHRVLWGEPPTQGPRGAERPRRAAAIAPSEGTRLLLNRCTGLLFARAQLEQTPFTRSAADFVRRNIAKVQLACGDAMLAAEGRYHWSCRDRHAHLQQLALREPSPWLEAVRRHHSEGVEFKLHPEADELPQAILLARHREVTALALQCWLWLEARRLGRPFASARAYAQDRGNKCPGSAPVRNLILNLRAGGLWTLRGPDRWRHPRQRALEALALLLWEPAVFVDPALLRLLTTKLKRPLHGAEDWIGAYRTLWGKVR